MNNFLKDLENIMDEVGIQPEYTILASDIRYLVDMSIKDAPAFKA